MSEPSPAVDWRARPESEVRARVAEIVLTWAPEPRPALAAETELVEHLAYHSLALLELAFALEGEFGLEPMDGKTARGIRTVADVEAHVLAGLASGRGETPPPS